jgi:dimethylargininase
LKSAVTSVADDWLLINPGWVDAARFGRFTLTEVDPAEPSAANVLRLGDAIVCAAGWPRTRARLEAAGLRTAAVDVSELAKAEAGVTCCSLILT